LLQITNYSLQLGYK